MLHFEDLNITYERIFLVSGLLEVTIPTTEPWVWSK
jgi:hypothetical protein